MTWDVTVPAGTDLVKNGDNVIREFKTDIKNGLTANDATLGDAGVFPGASASAPLYHYRGLKGTTAQRPAFTNYGLYFNETLNTIQRDNGSAWQDVGTLIPSGTVMAFYQATAPVGFTRVTTVNDKFIRIVSAGSPGSTGGAFAGTDSTASSGAHTHTVNSHTHSSGTLTANIEPALGANTLYAEERSTPVDNWTTNQQWAFNGNSASSSVRTKGVIVQGDTSASSPATDSQGAHTHTFTHGSAQHAYADFLIASKD